MGSTKRKQCGKCQVTKAIEEFSRNPRKSAPNARRSTCKECDAKRRREWAERSQDRTVATNRAWVAANPEKVKRYTLISRLRRHGLTLADYERMLEEQGGVCAICLGEPLTGQGRSFHIDHDHETGQVRGLLCNLCNLLLGHARDQKAVLERAIEYLDRNRHPSEQLTGTG